MNQSVSMHSKTLLDFSMISMILYRKDINWIQNIGFYLLVIIVAVFFFKEFATNFEVNISFKDLELEK